MKVRATTAIIFAALGVVAWLLINAMGNTIIAAMFLIYIVVVALLLGNPSENAYMLLFLIAFFVFLMGRPMMTEITGYDDSYYAVAIPKEAQDHTYFLLSISVVSLFVGYKVAGLLGGTHLSFSKKKKNSEHLIERVRYIANGTTNVFAVALLLVNIERALYVFRYGYLQSYLGINSIFPGFMDVFAEVYPSSFALYLATLPSKRESRWHISLFVILNGLYLLTGKRFEAVAAVLLLILYFSMRNKTDEEPWIQRKHVLALVAAVPFAMVFLIAMESWRAGGSIEKSFAELLFEFFDSVGGSSSIISYEHMYHEELAARGVWFSFGNMWRSLNGNAIAQMLGGAKIYANQTVENALYGHSLGAALMYKTNPARMLAGGGMGSCYIAELMCDFSYPGVVLGNMILGIVIRKLGKLERTNGLIKNFIIIYIACNIIRVPRDSFDFFFYQFFGIKNVLLWIVIAMISNSTQLQEMLGTRKKT